ncbi:MULTISPECIES: hypothetical protein [Citrobacter]|uniref:Uncharacterized protein n=1 Tax=Citrobacter werkmanii TaxID=67827 RepID=A0AA37Z6Q1_9ENTR|nr:MULTISPECIES: hypothetical protein [Citrobacter]MCU6172753.1 hypothetical protein [Citrobacter cronae]MDN8550465.1 hypothetical protein [Citrobacter werkmanii]MDN8555115.1 hypothetical protein [Citrobacter werkmanii]MDT0637901.1 hypothetical protein [Citrobacter werkmanii]MDV7071756.1 hypothetical protein [Citrobacter werkmanii]
MQKRLTHHPGEKEKTADPAHIVKRVVDKSGGLEFVAHCAALNADTA